MHFGSLWRDVFLLGLFVEEVLHRADLADLRLPCLRLLIEIMALLSPGILVMRLLIVSLGIRLEGAFRIFFSLLLFPYLLFFQVLAQVVNHQKIAMSDSFIRDLNVYRILSEDIVSPLNHLASVLFSQISTIWVDCRFERTLLSWGSSSDFLRIVIQKTVSEEGIKVIMNHFALLLINGSLFSYLNIVDASNRQEKDKETGLRKSRSTQESKCLSHQVVFFQSQRSCLIRVIDRITQSFQNSVEVLLLQFFFFLKIQRNQSSFEVLQKLLSSKFLNVGILPFILHRLIVWLKSLIILLISPSSCILIQQFVNRHISNDSLSSLRDLWNMIIRDLMKISFSFLVLKPVQPFMDVLFVVIVFFLIDGWRKSHVAVILILYSLFEIICLFVDLRLMVGL